MTAYMTSYPHEQESGGQSSEDKQMHLSHNLPYIRIHGIGGEAEAQAAYDEAVNAVFNLQLECHRHAQPHKSKKDGKMKWAMIEMWPIIVSTQHPHTLEANYAFVTKHQPDGFATLQAVHLSSTCRP